MAMPRDGVQTLRDTDVQPLGQTDVYLLRRCAVLAIICVRVRSIGQQVTHADRDCSVHPFRHRVVVAISQCCHQPSRCRVTWPSTIRISADVIRTVLRRRSNPTRSSSPSGRTPLSIQRQWRDIVSAAPTSFPRLFRIRAGVPDRGAGEAVSLRSVRCRVGFTAGMAKTLPADHRRCDNGPKGRWQERYCVWQNLCGDSL